MKEVAWRDDAMQQVSTTIAAAQASQADALLRADALGTAQRIDGLGHPGVRLAIERLAASAAACSSRVDRRLEYAMTEIERTARAVKAGDRWDPGVADDGNHPAG